MTTVSPQRTGAQELVSTTKLVFIAIYIVATVVVRITTRIILKRKDNLTILVSTTTTLLISATTLYYVSMTLRASNVTSWTIMGGLMTAVAVWRYNHYTGRKTN
jgi:hypothetical protein